MGAVEARLIYRIKKEVTRFSGSAPCFESWCLYIKGCEHSVHAVDVVEGEKEGSLVFLLQTSSLISSFRVAEPVRAIAGSVTGGLPRPAAQARGMAVGDSNGMTSRPLRR